MLGGGGRGGQGGGVDTHTHTHTPVLQGARPNSGRIPGSVYRLILLPLSSHLPGMHTHIQKQMHRLIIPIYRLRISTDSTIPIQPSAT